MSIIISIIIINIIITIRSIVITSSISSIVAIVSMCYVDSVLIEWRLEKPGKNM